jgi:thiol-disulfide isomerase/thioredoxin
MMHRPWRLAAASLCLAAVLLVTPAMAMAWSLQDSTGRTLSPASYPGQWVLVNFWATWCPPCKQEIPELIRLQHDKAGTLTIIGVAVSYRDSQVVLDFAREQGIDYPIVLGNEDIAAEFGGIRGLPESFLYAPDGKLVRRFEGPQTESTIEQALPH